MLGYSIRLGKYHRSNGEEGGGGIGYFRYETTTLVKMAAALTIPSLKNDRSLLCPFALIFDSIRTFRRDKRG